MKFLLVLVVVLFGFWLWRANRDGRKPPAQRPGSGAPSVIDVVRCEVCGVHCPKSDALAGKLGQYCSAQHRSQAEP